MPEIIAPNSRLQTPAGAKTKSNEGDVEEKEKYGREVGGGWVTEGKRKEKENVMGEEEERGKRGKKY